MIQPVGNSNMANYHIFVLTIWETDYCAWSPVLLKWVLTTKKKKKWKRKICRVQPYRRCTVALQMSSCYSRSWSPPTAADIHLGWRTSPPGKWCLGLSKEIKSNFVSIVSPTATTTIVIRIIKLHRPHIDYAVKLNVTLYVLEIDRCK